MNGADIGGIALLLYAVAVFWITLAKPPAIWQIGKIQGFVRILGETGTRVFFAIWGVAAAVIGVILIA